jgi:hypothetical protein
MNFFPVRVTIWAQTLYLLRESVSYLWSNQRRKQVSYYERTRIRKCNGGKSIAISPDSALSLFNPYPETVSAEMKSNHYSTRVESVNEHQCKNMQTHAKPSLLFPYTNFALILLSLGFKLIKKEWEAGRISSAD